MYSPIGTQHHFKPRPSMLSPSSNLTEHTRFIESSSFPSLDPHHQILPPLLQVTTPTPQLKSNRSEQLQNGEGQDRDKEDREHNEPASDLLKASVGNSEEGTRAHGAL